MYVLCIRTFTNLDAADYGILKNVTITVPLKF